MARDLENAQSPVRQAPVELRRRRAPSTKRPKIGRTCRTSGRHRLAVLCGWQDRWAGPLGGDEESGEKTREILNDAVEPLEIGAVRTRGELDHARLQSLPGGAIECRGDARGVGRVRGEGVEEGLVVAGTARDIVQDRVSGSSDSDRCAGGNRPLLVNLPEPEPARTETRIDEVGDRESAIRHGAPRHRNCSSCRA